MPAYTTRGIRIDVHTFGVFNVEESPERIAVSFRLELLYFALLGLCVCVCVGGKCVVSRLRLWVKFVIVYTLFWVLLIGVKMCERWRDW